MQRAGGRFGASLLGACLRRRGRGGCGTRDLQLRGRLGGVCPDLTFNEGVAGLVCSPSPFVTEEREGSGRPGACARHSLEG